jgi:hypothetical protein
VERVAKHPERIKNLYFVFAATLRAVSHMAPRLSEVNVKSGVDEKADEQATKSMTDLLTAVND